MAENKKSFILYTDQKDLFNKLPDADAGKLIKHIFSYVNDENPTTDNLLIEVAFEPIKRQMKRDLQKWDKAIQQRSEAGKASAESRRKAKELLEKENSTKSTAVESRSTKSTVNDNVTDNVINNEIVEQKAPPPSQNLKSTLPDRKTKFYDSLTPFVETYGKAMVRKFFDYWTELNKSQTKMRWELEKVFEIKKRLATWASRDNNFNNKKPETPAEVRVRKSEVNG